MKKLFLAAVLAACLANHLMAGPVDDFVKTIKGTDTEKVVPLPNRKASCSFYKLADAMDLNKSAAGGMPKQPQSSPVELMQALSVLFSNLNAENVKTIKSYHAPDDLIQRIPTDRFIAMLQKDRKDWVISTIVRDGDLIFLCGQYKDGKTGKIEKDVWPMMFQDGSWHVVVATRNFITVSGMDLMQYLAKD
jgi:hypothetical protein